MSPPRRAADRACRRAARRPSARQRQAPRRRRAPAARRNAPRDPVRCSRSAPAFAGGGQRTPTCTRFDQQIQPPLAAVQHVRRRRQAERVRRWRRRADRSRRDDLDVADRVLPAPQRSDRRRPRDARRARAAARASARRCRRRGRAGCAESRARSVGSAAAMARFDRFVEPGEASRIVCSRRRRRGRRPT